MKALIFITLIMLTACSMNNFIESENQKTNSRAVYKYEISKSIKNLYKT